MLSICFQSSSVFYQVFNQDFRGFLPFFVQVATRPSTWHLTGDVRNGRKMDTATLPLYYLIACLGSFKAAGLGRRKLSGSVHFRGPDAIFPTVHRKEVPDVPGTFNRWDLIGKKSYSVRPGTKITGLVMVVLFRFRYNNDRRSPCIRISTILRLNQVIFFVVHVRKMTEL